jgi:hypothetical protein
MPRIGHEVWVDFIQGNIDCPIVMGTVLKLIKEPAGWRVDDITIVSKAPDYEDERPFVFQTRRHTGRFHRRPRIYHLQTVWSARQERR